jgi:hypothetical protein
MGSRRRGAGSGAVEEPAMIFRCVERLLLVWHGREPVADTEWQEMLELLKSHWSNEVKVLVFTQGGAPSASQQLALAKLSAVKTFTGAILSDSAGMRFVVSSFALFIKRIRTFPSVELQGASAFLELSEAEHRAAESFLSELNPPAQPTTRS